MKPGNRDRIVMEFAAGLLACAGGYALLVQPGQGRLAEANAQILTLVASGSGAEGGSVPSAERLSETVRSAESTAARIRDRSAIAMDEAALFEAVMRLADEHGVRVDHLQPTDTASRQVASAATPPPPPPPVSNGPGAPGVAVEASPLPADSMAGYSISVVGRYADVAAFTRAVSRNAGFAVVRSMRLTPGETPGADEVEALVRTEHHVFDTSAVMKIAGAPAAVAVPTE